MERLAERLRSLAFWRSGQASVEAALMLPVLLGLLLLLVQPGIVLYDQMVMRSAAAEACRTLCTAAGNDQDIVTSLVLRRLGSVPQHELFHVHDGGCSWDVSLSGNESSGMVRVTLGNELKPVPLISFFANALGLTTGRGTLQMEVVSEMKTQPDWTASSPAGPSAADWVGAWLE